MYVAVRHCEVPIGASIKNVITNVVGIFHRRENGSTCCRERAPHQVAATTTRVLRWSSRKDRGLGNNMAAAPTEPGTTVSEVSSPSPFGV